MPAVEQGDPYTEALAGGGMTLEEVPGSSWMVPASGGKVARAADSGDDHPEACAVDIPTSTLPPRSFSNKPPWKVVV